MAQTQKNKEKTSENQTDSPKKGGLLSHINIPQDLKQLTNPQLTDLCEEIRDFMIATIAQTGGHLGASLGVVELSVALHKTFNAPEDKIIWDVGHQSYPHKILTGRKDKMHKIRKGGGLCGFTNREESIYDPFGAGHSSTSISAGLGMATAVNLDKKNNHIISIIGDGSISAGMAYEAMNNAGNLKINGKKTRLIVILNDNDMSIAPPVGAISSHLTKLVSSKPYINARETGKKITDKLPSPIRHVAKRAEEHARHALGSGSMFEEMGFYYIGPVDGHNMDDLTSILANVRDSSHEGPVLIHAVTQKGKGYGPAENAADKMHGVKKFDILTGNQIENKTGTPPAQTYTDIFADTLIECANSDSKILGITAAMPSGTGLDKFEQQFPERFFDVGIAEQHAVTFAAGLAAQGYKPFVAIYSTFMQRAYDQIVHDVALQNLPVRFAIDRAGLVGEDGQTHAGSFDIAYLACIPNMIIMSPSDEQELASMIKFAAKHDDGPIAFRYPRAQITGKNKNKSKKQKSAIETGKGRIIQNGKKIALLSLGTRLEECQKAARIIKDTKNIDITIADARFAKPLDRDMICTLAKKHELIITIEEGSRGGFGSCVLDMLSNKGFLDNGNLKLRTMTLPDIFQPQNTQKAQYDQAKLNAEHIVEMVISCI